MPVAAQYIFLTGLFLLSVANVALGTTEACLPAGEKKNGMTINFYQYSLKDSSTYSNPSYMAYGYADAEKLGSVSGQTKLSIDYSIPCNGASDTCACSDDDATEYSASQVVPVKRGVKLCSDNTTLSSGTKKRENDDCDQGAAYWSPDLFGFYTTPTNVTVEMTGYFLPPKTGTYTFGFATVDDSAILSIGGNVAFECCKQEQPPITSTDFTINGIKPWNADAPTDIKGSTYMYAGYYYPIKIVYSNAVSWGTLPVSVVLPGGTEVNDDFEGYVFSFDDNATQAHCSVPNPADHARTCVSSATSSWSSSEVCKECTETESTSTSTPYVTSSSWSSSEVCTECTETESTSYVTPYVTSSSWSSSEVCTECTETESTSTSTPYVTSSSWSSSEVCTECTETESTSTSTPYVTSSSWSSSEVCTECTETESTSYVTPYVTSSSWSSSEVCTECTETESTSTSTPYVTSSSWSSSEVCTECTETESTSYVTPYVTSSSWSSSEVCTECTETESTSTSTPYVTSSSWSSSEVCTECTETESTSTSTPYVTSSSWSSSEVCTECTETESTSTSTPYVTSSSWSSSEVCTECTETESTSTSTPYATSSTSTATSFTASTSNTMKSLVQTDTTVSFSLSSTVSKHTNAPTSSVESNASTFISSNKGSVKSYVTSSIHSITPMYPSNQTVTSSSVVSTPITSESSESSASVTILPSTITSEFKPSTMKTKVVSISSSPTNLITSYDTTFKDSTVGSSTVSVSLIFSISLPSSYSASSEQIFHSSIVSSNGQALPSFSSTKVSTSESSESYRTLPTTSSESGIKSSGVEIESTSTSSFSFHETSTASTSVQISSQFVTPSSPISTVAPRSTGPNSQTESTNSSKETMSSENSARVMPSSSATSPKTGKVTSDETSYGFSRDRTTVYRMTSETPSTNEQTTLITVSSCESNSCSNTVSSAVVSTATTTINGITTEYTTWCPLSATELTKVSKLESEEKTTLITVNSCESGVCSETASPAIVSTATATVNDVVTVYSTWSPQATNKLAVSSVIENSASKASFVSEAAETKSISRNNNFVPTSGTTYIETHTTTTSNASENSDNVSASEAVSSKSVTNPVLISVSRQPRGTPASSMIGSSTASLEMSSYLGIANHLLTNSGISIFIASLLLAIV
ncbi:CEI_1a_G0038830.mRNA.1.CDS.1 [Saccharomyces cerevisiae]|nr:CEI_1a_G0038830.mRNA.1.CDS.1 [Saccharomyces cerevisiae]CAI7435293.1 CEI_1a_G0038830.mRNA.1.CDS.1 [Saccharomyces cerevisiae]